MDIPGPLISLSKPCHEWSQWQWIRNPLRNVWLTVTPFWRTFHLFPWYQVILDSPGLPSQPQGAPVVSQNCPSLTLTSFSFQFDGAGAPFLSESGTGEQRSEILRTERSDSVVRRAARRPDTACHTRTSSTSWPATSARTPRMTRQTHSPTAGTSAA